MAGTLPVDPLLSIATPRTLGTPLEPLPLPPAAAVVAAWVCALLLGGCVCSAVLAGEGGVFVRLGPAGLREPVGERSLETD